ncbi:MAG: nucleotidyltransferase domain-containing protein [Agarilytica sp.]
MLQAGLATGEISQIKAALIGFPEVDSAILYGSRARGTYKPGSDIDLTLLGEKVDFSCLAAIGTALDDLLPPYSFDLSIFHEIDNKKLVEHIERVGISFYEGPKPKYPLIWLCSQLERQA